jgi:hypothetical protein
MQVWNFTRGCNFSPTHFFAGRVFGTESQMYHLTPPGHRWRMLPPSEGGDQPPYECGRSASTIQSGEGSLARSHIVSWMLWYGGLHPASNDWAWGCSRSEAARGRHVPTIPGPTCGKRRLRSPHRAVVREHHSCQECGSCKMWNGCPLCTDPANGPPWCSMMGNAMITRLTEGWWRAHKTKGHTFLYLALTLFSQRRWKECNEARCGA